MKNRDIVVIGASAGGVAALGELLRHLPKDLPAAVFIVLHVEPRVPSLLPGILSRASALPVAEAQDGETIRHGHVYVARPDYHLLIDGETVRLGHGPKEHHTRPAVDPLFRSAAEQYGDRVVGVVLTGARTNGSLGLLAIKQHGGVTMAQDPAEARYPSMPASAIRMVGVDRVLPLADLADELTRVVLDPPEPPAEAGAREPVSAANPKANEAVRLTCPECGAAMLPIGPDGLPSYRCEIGHLLAGEEVLEAQAEELERALWTAVRLAEQQALLADRLLTALRDEGDDIETASLQAAAAGARRYAGAIRRLLEEKAPPA